MLPRDPSGLTTLQQKVLDEVLTTPEGIPIRGTASLREGIHPQTARALARRRMVWIQNKRVFPPREDMTEVKNEAATRIQVYMATPEVDRWRALLRKGSPHIRAYIWRKWRKGELPAPITQALEAEGMTPSDKWNAITVRIREASARFGLAFIEG